MIPWFGPHLSGDELGRIKSVLDSGFINEGPVTRKFEQRVAALAGRRYGVAVPSGTTAIALALMAAGLRLGDEVIVPDFTYVATANAVRLAGGRVVLADIDPGNFCLSVEALRRTLRRQHSTRFVIPVEVNGRRPDPAIYQLCSDFGAIAITDSCEALGSADCGSHGLASCFSFSPNKLVTTGQGGMVVTDDDKLCERLHELKYQGMKSRGTGGRDLHPSLGFNFKFNDILAAVGLAQLDALPDRIEKCRQRDKWYHEAINGPLLRMAPDEVCLWTDALFSWADEVAEMFDQHGIGYRQFWHPIHTQEPYRTTPAFPVTDLVSPRGIWLPSSHDITQEQVQRVVRLIREVALVEAA